MLRQGPPGDVVNREVMQCLQEAAVIAALGAAPIATLGAAAMPANAETFIRAILGTPPELVAKASAEEQARIQRSLDHILPIRPRREKIITLLCLM